MNPRTVVYAVSVLPSPTLAFSGFPPYEALPVIIAEPRGTPIGLPIKKIVPKLQTAARMNWRMQLLRDL
jgi:hypothetical protein